MIKKVDVIFFVEHKDRELESIKLVCEQLKKNNISSLILSVYFHVHYLYLYKARVFVFPYLINKNDWPANIVYKMYGNNAEYMNMNWEQLISKVNEEYKKPQDNFVKKEVKHIAWNENFKSYLERYDVLGTNIEITGNPANEILFNLLDKQEDWKDKLSKDFNLDKSKKWLFMPMNYGWAFSSDKLINAKIKKGYPKETAWEYRDYSQKCLKKFILFIEKLSQDYDYEIIVRPHPSITEDDYKKVFNEIIGYVPSNIYLNKEHSIREWIVASDIIGSSWSTSVWDAYNIGKNVFLFTPYSRPDWLDVWWNDEVVNIDIYNEDNIIKSNKNINKLESSKKISDFISNDLLKTSKSNNIKRFVFDLKSTLKVIRSFLHEKNIINPKSLKYDYFKRVFNER